jgi:hypothetical protein
MSDKPRLYYLDHLRVVLTVLVIAHHVGQAYGTRSATILRLAPSLVHSELYVADGAPCTSPFQDRSQLLTGLAQDRAHSA